jgi:hypothetical protein
MATVTIHLPDIFSITLNLSVDPLCRGSVGLYGTLAPVTIHLPDIFSITPNLSVDPLCRGSTGLYATLVPITHRGSTDRLGVIEKISGK